MADLLSLLSLTHQTLDDVIDGRAFRLRKGDVEWKKKPVPIVKNQVPDIVCLGFLLPVFVLLSLIKLEELLSMHACV